MKNCSFKSLIKTIIFFLCFSLPNFSSAYIPETTHAGLTDQIIEFYNMNFSENFTDVQKELIIKGSTDEDYPSIRALNHFYDPINNIGIEGSRTSKEWTTDGNIESNEFSWPKAIEYYTEGDSEKAFVSLGHILHLFEDMGVPDHTRNDPHMGDNFTGSSPYEKWASDNKDRQTLGGVALEFDTEGLKPRIFDDIGSYFDFLAVYSNSNFFSPDTIANGEYNLPEISSKDKKYEYSTDNILGESYKVLKLVVNNQDKNKIDRVLTDGNDFTILSSYFDRLSKQIIPSGAGLVNLFIKEAKIAREKYLEEQKIKAEEALKKDLEMDEEISNSGFFGKIAIGFQILINNQTEKIIFTSQRFAETFSHNFKTLVQETGNSASIAGGVSKKVVVLAEEQTKNLIEETGKKYEFAIDKISSIISSNVSDNVEQDNSPKVNLSEEETKLIISLLKNSQTKPEENSLAPVVYSFTGGSSGGQPIIQETTVPIGQGTTTISTTTLEQEIVSTTTSATSSEVIATTSDISIIINSPTCVYSFLADECAVPTSTILLNWEPSREEISFYNIFINGEISTTTSTSTEIFGLQDGELKVEISAVDMEGLPIATSTKTIKILSLPVVINEIAWAGAASNTDQWIELYNNTDSDIDLSSWKIHSTSSSLNIYLSGTIRAHDYFLIENASSSGTSSLNLPILDIQPDLLISFSENLRDSGEQLILSYTFGESSSSEEIISDMLPYCENWCENGKRDSGNYSMERFDSEEPTSDSNNWGTNLGIIKNSLDKNNFSIFGTPKRKNSISYLPVNSLYTTQNVILKKEKSPYLILGGLYVDTPGKLTIEPGVIVKFYYLNSLITSAIMTGGEVKIGEDSGEKIIFTDFGDRSVGTEIGEGYESENSSGGLIIFDGSSGVSIKNFDLKNIKEGIQIYSGQIVVNNLDIFGDEGIRIFGGNLNISDSDIHDVNNNYGIWVFDDSGFVADNIKVSNVINPEGNSSRGIGALNSNIDIKNSIIEDIYGGDGMDLFENVTAFLNNLQINSFDNHGIFIDNLTTLNADGVSIEGGSNGFFGGGQAEIKNSSIKYSGEGIFWWGGDLSVENSIIENNEIGLKFVSGANSLNILNSIISGNFSFGVVNQSTEKILDAQNNWWGSNTGPLSVVSEPEPPQTYFCINEETEEEYECEGTREERWRDISNPEGLGNKVSGRIDFANWLTTIPVI